MLVRRVSIVLIIFAVINLLLTADHKVDTFKLSNGLTVILSPSNGVESTCVLLYHKTGTRDDPAELKGGTYLYQSLMLLGTRNLEPYERLMFVEKHGGISSQRVSYDNSIFYQVVPDSELNNALWLESERINSLKLTDREINVVKSSTYRRIYSSIHGNVNFEANSWIKSKIFDAMVYQTPVYGNLEEIRSFDNQEIRKIYGRFRNPADIIMVIAGKFDTAELREYVNRHFAGLSLQNKKDHERKNSSRSNPKAEYTYRNWLRQNIPQHFVMCGIKSPSRRSFDHLFFNFIHYYLLDERISKLQKMMNRVNDLDVTIDSEYTNQFETNALIIKISTPHRSNVENAKFILDKELDALLSRPLSQSELRIVKSLMEIDFKKDMATLEKRSIILAENLHLSGALKFGNQSFEEMYIDRIRKINSYDVWEISKKYLKKSNRVILNVYKK